MRRQPLPLDCRLTPFDLACRACGYYALGCELLACVDRICCERCSHPDTLYFWRVLLLVQLQVRADRPELEALVAHLELLAQHVGWETARAQWLGLRAARERPS